MTPRQKKNLEIAGYLAIEVGLVTFLAFFKAVPEEVLPVITVAMIYFGKELVKKCKE